MTSRGIRNNNPGNIERNPRVHWQGAAEFDPAIEPRFERFIAPEYGLRAIGRVLMTYRHRGVVSIRAIVSRWAPAGENDTEAYIAAVTGELGVDALADYDVTDAARMAALLAAIVRHENGVQPYDAATLARAAAMALKGN